MTTKQNPLNSVTRSATAPIEELIVPCEVTECGKKFRTFMGMRTHLKRVHNITHKERKLQADLTICTSCNKDFKNSVSLAAHGTPETCAKRKKKGWQTLICQNPNCGQTYEKYLGANGTRKGGKYCSVACSNSVPKICKKCNTQYLGTVKSQYCPGDRPTPNRTPHEKRKPSPNKPRTKKTRTKKPKVCAYCNSKFESKHRRKGCFTCVPTAGGPRPGGGKSKQLPFTSRHGEEMSLNREEILMCEYLDTLPVKWTRNWKGFPYVSLSGSNRKFYPDFYIPAYDLYVEYKGWITKEMHHKMSEAQKDNADLNLSIVVGGRKSIQDAGIPLKDLQNGDAVLPLNLLQ